MTSQLPPMVPEEVNLRGLPWMRLDTGRLLDSDFFSLSTGDQFKAALALWCKSWTQVPAASLPTDDKILMTLSGVGTMKRWLAVKDMALRGWRLCTDGRLYHPIVAEQALVAWDERLKYQSKKDAESERKHRERLARQDMFEQLRAHGKTPAWNITTQQLRDLVDEVTHLSRVTGGDQSRGHPASVTPHVTAKTGRDGTGRDTSIGSSSTSVEFEEGEGADDSLPESGLGAMPDDTARVVVIGAGPAAAALRKMGIRVNSLDPTLLALLAESVTAEEMCMVAAQKAIDNACMNNDPDVDAGLLEMLANGFNQAQMRLTSEQWMELQRGMPGINYIAGAVRGKRADAARIKGKIDAKQPDAPDGGHGANRSAVSRVRAANAAAERRERAHAAFDDVDD